MSCEQEAGNSEKMTEQDTTKNGRLFVISGPSGCGKSTLCRKVLPRTNAGLSVSATTRDRSKSETDGVDYYFLSKKEFKDKIDADEFLEYAQVFENYYGTPAKPVMEKLKDGQTIILEIDVQGAIQVFNRYPEAIGILVLPPSKEILQQRLSQRGRDDKDTIKKRLDKAEWEIEQAQNNKNFKHTVVNDNLDEAIEKMVRIIE